MAFNPDDKIQWENFSPTLQALLERKIKEGGEDYFNNHINKYVDKAINTANSYTNAQINSPAFMQKILVNVMSTEPTGEFKKYMDNAIFTNLPPKVGYLDDTKMQIYSAFNMSFNSVYNRAPWICSDSEGRTNIWFEASSSTSEPLKIFRGFRVFESAEFSFENDPIIPEFLVTRNAKGDITSTSGYIAHIMAMECGYMIVQLNNGQYHFINTKFSGNPRNWTDHRDVTAAFNHASSNYGAYLGCLYSKKYNKLLLVNTSNNVIRMSIYNNSNKLVRNGIWFDWSVQGSGVTQSYKNIPGYSAGGYLCAPSYYSAGNTDMLVFNKDDNLLHLILGLTANIYQNSGTYLKLAGVNWNVIYVIVSKVDENTLFNGSETPTQQMPPSVYENVRGNSPNNFPGGMKTGTWATKSMAYDTLLKRYVIVRHIRDHADSDLYFTKKDSIKADLWQQGTEMFGIIATERFMPPDACPWAKKLYVPQVRYEALYLRGCSKTFGDYQYIGFQKTYNKDKGFSVQAGSWKINPTKTCGINDLNVCCAMNGENYADWWYCAFNGRTQIYIQKLKTTNRTTSTGLTIQDVLDVDGAATTYDISWMASLLNEYELYKVAYHPATDTIYIFAWWKSHRLSSIDVSNSNRGLWLFMVNRSNNSLIGKWRLFGTSKFDYENSRLTSTDNCVYQPRFTSNVFIISRDEFVIKCHGDGNIGSWYEQTSWFKPSGQSGQNWIETPVGIGNDPSWCGGDDGCIGWNKTYNYFICNSPITFYSSGVASSKNKFLGDKVYTKEEFYGGKAYQETYGLAGSIGLVCTIPATPIFLGGYFSIIPATEVPLYDNATNYIYLHRDPDDRTNVFIECYPEPISKLPKTSTGDTYSDASQFSRVIVAEIETSAGYPIKQIVYPVGDGYLK